MGPSDSCRPKRVCPSALLGCPQTGSNLEFLNLLPGDLVFLQVLTALLTQSMGASANLARHFEQLGPEQLAKFDVDVFCRNLAPARKK